MGRLYNNRLAKFNITAFAKEHSIARGTVINHLKQGYCKYPRVRHLGTAGQTPKLLNYNETRLKRIKHAAENRKMSFNLTLEDIEALPQYCIYCKESLTEQVTGYSVDRVDPNHGYIKHNIVPCCPTCNKIKNNLLTFEEMLVAMNAIRQYRKNFQ